MQNKKCLERCLELIRDKRYRELSAILAEQNPVDLADLLEGLPQEQGALAFRTLPKEQAAEVFSNLPPDTQQMIVVSLPDRELAGILEELAMDDTVDLLEELPAGVVKRVLKNARPETRRLINQFLKYPEQSVGSIMTAEFIDLKGTMTAAEAIRRIRRLGGDCESIYTCYVTDGRRVLDGVVTLRELLLAPDNAPVRTLMEPNVITVRTTDDQELAVRALMRYDFLSLPVVDQEDRLVGVVTVDDVMDVMEEEATEDFQRMAAMAPSEKSYLKTGVFALAKNRILWLLVLMISGMITGGILGRYEAAFSVIPQGALEGAEGQPAGGRGPLPGQPGPPAPLLPGKRAGVRHSHPVPVRYGGPGQDHRRSSAHAGQAGAGRPRHHGRPSDHHHRGRPFPGPLLHHCQPASPPVRIHRRKSWGARLAPCPPFPALPPLRIG